MIAESFQFSNPAPVEREKAMDSVTEVPAGKKLIFRKWRICKITGRRIYAKTAFPMIVDA
jgi:hypothetical protein